MNILRTIPKKIAVAVSGGADSIAALHYFHARKFDITAVNFQHAESAFAEKGSAFVESVCRDLGVNFIVGRQTGTRNKQSLEEYWRNGRYEFFKSLKIPVVTGHTLNDAVEWYLYSMLNGKMSLMPYCNENVIRPFILTTRKEIESYLQKNSIRWIEDPSNADVTVAKRNFVRHRLMSPALEINPGLFTMIKRMIISRQLEKENNLPG